MYSDIDFLTKRGITIKNYVYKLSSLIAGYYGAYSDCIDIEELKNSMSNWARKALKKLLNNQYNINYDTLNDKQKKFLDF
jgi:hypothetical protein